MLIFFIGTNKVIHMLVFHIYYMSLTELKYDEYFISMMFMQFLRPTQLRVLLCMMNAS